MRRPQTTLNSASAGATVVAVLSLGLAVSTASAQQLFQAPAPPPPAAVDSPSTTYDPMASARNPRALLRNGNDFIKYKDFTRALRFLREAEKRQAELDPAERKALAMSIAHAQAKIQEGSVKPTAAQLANASLPKRDLDAIQAGGMALAANEPAPKGDQVQLTSNETPKLGLDKPSDGAKAPVAEQPASIEVELAAPSPSPEKPLNAPPIPAAAPPIVMEAPAPLPAAPIEVELSSGPAGKADDRASARPEPLPDMPKADAPKNEPPPIIGLEPPSAAPEPVTAPAPKPAPIEERPAAEPETRVAGATRPLAEQSPAPAPPPSLPAPEPAPAPIPIPVNEPAPLPSPAPAAAPLERPQPVAPLGSPASNDTTPPVPSAVEPPPAVEAEAVLPKSEAPATAPASAPVESGVPAAASAEIQAEIARIAARDPQDPKPTPPPIVAEDPALGANDAQTRFELPRPPSSTEARPLRRIPVPEEFVPFGKREWEPQKKFWAAPATCHMPLYFQDAALERYGHSVETYFGSNGRFLTYPLDKPSQSKQRNQILQPFFSTGLFAFQVVTLPYRIVVDPPWEAEYDLGYYRPGDRMPRSTTYLPWTGVGPPLKGRNY